MTMPFHVTFDDLPELADLDMSAWTRFSSPALMFYRLWPDDSTDVLVVQSRTEAFGERADGEGAPVWRCRASPAVVVAAFLALGDPGRYEHSTD
ncbi:hypothetical protein [Actinokineospora sp. NPDC004072]